MNAFSRFLLFIMLVSVPFSGTFSEPALFVETETDQGDFITVIVDSPDNLVSLYCTLKDKEGRAVTAATGFRPGDGLSDTMVCLIGVPLTASPGIYPLTAEATDGRGKHIINSLVTVRGKAFIYEEIRLTGEMAALRESEDPRKTEEAVKLMALYGKTDTESVFHKDRLNLPVAEERRTSFYGDTRKYLYPDGKSSKSVHYGIDFGGRTGTPVYAAGSGRVVMVAERIITGLTVVIEHLPGVYSSYFHLSEIMVKENDMAEKGTIIGKIGATGFVTGPHLHWELRVSGVPVNPDQAIKWPLIDKNAIFSKMGYTKE